MTTYDAIAAKYILQSLLTQYKIKNYTIRPDGIVDVEGHVRLIGCEFSKIPIKFGTITGDFNCSHCHNLESLEGAPDFVIGTFHCYENPQVRSLVGFNTLLRADVFMSWHLLGRGGISLALSGALKLKYATGPFHIIDKYLERPEDIFECQAELIEAGYAEYAIL